MQNVPNFDIDIEAFWHNPYPIFKQLRETAPIAYVPQLGAILFTRRDDIRLYEKKIEIFSSHQPDGLMTKLMGENLMRKDGEEHLHERKVIFPTVSPKTVRDHWVQQFQIKCDKIIAELISKKSCDLVADFAMPMSAEALKLITGLSNCMFKQMNDWSQAMIDGIANYAGDAEIESRCNHATDAIDAHIDERIKTLSAEPDFSLLSVLLRSDLPRDSVHANIKLAISGGQNEARDVIAGIVWALLTHPTQLHAINVGEADWGNSFDEYVRWMAPIGMSPRRVAAPFEIDDMMLEPEDRAFFMFSSANHDEVEFDQPEIFDISRPNSSAHIAFGAGPHFCAGAAASRALITQVSLPTLFASLPKLRLQENAEIDIGGWAFRGLLNLPVAWD